MHLYLRYGGILRCLTHRCVEICERTSCGMVVELNHVTAQELPYSGLCEELV